MRPYPQPTLIYEDKVVCFTNHWESLMGARTHAWQISLLLTSDCAILQLNILSGLDIG